MTLVPMTGWLLIPPTEGQGVNHEIKGRERHQSRDLTWWQPWGTLGKICTKTQSPKGKWKSFSKESQRWWRCPREITSATNIRESNPITDEERRSIPGHESASTECRDGCLRITEWDPLDEPTLYSTKPSTENIQVTRWSEGKHKPLSQTESWSILDRGSGGQQTVEIWKNVYP